MIDKLIEMINQDCATATYYGDCWHVRAIAFLEENRDKIDY